MNFTSGGTTSDSPLHHHFFFYSVNSRQQLLHPRFAPMSLSQTSGPLRRWPRLCSQFQSSRPLSAAASPNKLPRNPRTSHSYTHHDSSNTTSQRNRLFHSTPYNAVARSPTVRRSQAMRDRPGDVPALYNRPVPGNKDARKQFLNEHGARLCEDAIVAKMLVDIDLRVFMKVAHALFDEAYTASPSGAAIRNISEDPDLVFEIGKIISLGDPAFREWVLAACALADVHIALFTCAARLLKKTKAAPKAQILDQVKSIALHERDPVAMTLHAQVLGLREEYPQALALIEEAIQALYPASSPPKNMFPPGFRTPWHICEWLKRKVGDDAGADEVVKVAALEYQEPQALVRYAGRLMQERDLESYEESMSKAAAGGLPEACQKLANFYLLTSLGQYPRRGDVEWPTAEKIEKEEAKQATPNQEWGLSSFFNRSLSRADYHKLAREWYEVACIHGNKDAALTFSLLLRQEGDFALGRHYLDMAAQKLDLAAIRGYRVNWDKENVAMGSEHFSKLTV